MKDYQEKLYDEDEAINEDKRKRDLEKAKDGHCIAKDYFDTHSVFDIDEAMQEIKDMYSEIVEDPELADYVRSELIWLAL